MLTAVYEKICNFRHIFVPSISHRYSKKSLSNPKRKKCNFLCFKNPDAHPGALANIKCRKAHWNVLTKRKLLDNKTVCILHILPFVAASTVSKQVSLLLAVASNTLSKFSACDLEL